MKHTIRVLKALSDKNRLRIFFSLLEHKELCACQITELLEVKGATASRHLAKLSSANLIDSRKSGRWVFYFLNQDFLKKDNNHLFQWLKQKFEVSGEFEKDKKTLAKILKEDKETICRRQRCCPTSEL